MYSSKKYSLSIGLWKGTKWALIGIGSALATAGLTDITLKDIVLYVLDGSGFAHLTIGAIITIVLNFVNVKTDPA